MRFTSLLLLTAISASAEDIYVQWTQRNPQDWVKAVSTDWGSLPNRREPLPGELGGLDNTRGWIFDLNVMGVKFAGHDHYHVQEQLGFTRVTVWNDDLTDWPVGTRNAIVADFYPLTQDQSKGGVVRGGSTGIAPWNTKIRMTRYRENPDDLSRLELTADQSLVLMRPWSEFTAPSSNVRHGVWTTDAKMSEHIAAQSTHGWREWVSGVPLDQTEVDGRGIRVLKPQRSLGRFLPNSATRTYYLTSTDQAVGYVAYTYEKIFSTSASSGSLVMTIPGGWNAYLATWVTPANEPGTADWPSGDYRVQLDISAIGATGAIHFADFTLSGMMVVDSGLTTFGETKAYGGANITTTGQHLRSVSWDPASGNQSDRFAIRLGMRNTDMMVDTTVTLATDADSFADGPWAGAGSTVVKDVIRRGAIAAPR